MEQDSPGAKIPGSQSDFTSDKGSVIFSGCGFNFPMSQQS